MADLNRVAAERFVALWNMRDIDGFHDLFHEKFQWHIAVTEPGVSELRPLQSNLLKGRNLSWDKAIYDKMETIEIFGGIFKKAAEFTIKPHSYTSQNNRIAVELLGSAYNAEQNRRYNNIYCYMLEIRDGKIILFREYQDTLLLFDAWLDD